MVNATRSDSQTKTCTLEGCSRPLRARGLCASHYNVGRPRTMVEVACPACGTVTTKHLNGANTRRYCSLMCRDYDRWGPRSSPWPRIVKATRKPSMPKPAPFRATLPCAWCGSLYLSTRRGRTLCSDACKRRASRARRRARETNASGSYTWAEVSRLWLMIGKRCAYCHEPKANDEIEPDHVHPLSRSGSNSIHNIAPSCSPCNSDKRDLTLEEWAVDRVRRSLSSRTIHPLLSHRAGTPGA